MTLHPGLLTHSLDSVCATVCSTYSRRAHSVMCDFSHRKPGINSLWYVSDIKMKLLMLVELYVYV